jgi:preprotein translocase subunit SecF
MLLLSPCRFKVDYQLLLALFFLGGEIIHSFATALLIGVVVGTYSSIYVASSMILMLGISKEDLLENIASV